MPFVAIKMGRRQGVNLSASNLSDRSCTALGTVGRKTRRAEDMVNCSNVFAPVLSLAMGVPLPPEHPSLQR